MFGAVFALVILIAVLGIVTNGVIGAWARRNDPGSTSGRLAAMEERIQRIESATSGLIAEFAAVRERERFMTQLVESRARRDAKTGAETPSNSVVARPGDDTSPYVVQTVSAVRRSPKTAE
jgi:hypothetical protein